MAARPSRKGKEPAREFSPPPKAPMPPCWGVSDDEEEPASPPPPKAPMPPDCDWDSGDDEAKGKKEEAEDVYQLDCECQECKRKTKQLHYSNWLTEYRNWLELCSAAIKATLAQLGETKPLSPNLQQRNQDVNALYNDVINKRREYDSYITNYLSEGFTAWNVTRSDWIKFRTRINWRIAKLDISLNPINNPTGFSSGVTSHWTSTETKPTNSRRTFSQQKIFNPRGDNGTTKSTTLPLRSARIPPSQLDG